MDDKVKYVERIVASETGLQVDTQVYELVIEMIEQGYTDKQIVQYLLATSADDHV